MSGCVYCLTVGSVVRASLWLYIAGLLANFVSFIFWMIAAYYLLPNVIGTAAAIIALNGLLTSVFSFGLPIGIRRYIGRSSARKDYQHLSSYFFTSLAFTLLLTFSLTTIILLVAASNYSLFNLASFELTFVALLLVLSLWTPVFSSLFVSILRTEMIALARTVSSLLKLFVSVFLLILGLNLSAVLFGFITASIAMDVVLVFYATRLFRGFGVGVKIHLSYLRTPLKAGIASWIPEILYVLANSFGILTVFTLIGGAETGLYFIAFAIASMLYSFPQTIQSLMFPVLSGMEKGKKKAISRAIQLTLAVTVPIALLATIYSSIPLSILGFQYIQASNIFAILAVGSIIDPIVSGYISYVYALGKYTHVALISLVTNGSRLVLYVVLVPLLGGIGAGFSYTLGIIVALVPMLFSARSIMYKPRWVQHARTIAIPLLLSVLFLILNFPWFIGVPVLLVISVFAYARLEIITKRDVFEISQAFLSKETITKLSSLFRPLIRLMFGG